MSKSLKKPDFFIVGAPKSGTTSLVHYLGQHPDIFMPYRKEMHFFGSDLTKIPHEFFVLDKTRYLAQFTCASNIKRAGEASVMYLYSRSAAQEIIDFNPEARIIIMLRNPVDMLYAYHSQLLWGGYENITNFEEALNAEPDRRCGRRIPRCTMMQESLYYRDVARFSKQVERYFDVFGRERVHVILFEDFKQDLTGTYQRTLDFLEVEHFKLNKFKIVNPNKVARYQWYSEMIQRPPRPLQMLLNLIPDRQRHWLLGKLSRINTRYVRRPDLEQELQEQIVQEFKTDINMLEILLQRDLSMWKQIKTADQLDQSTKAN